VGQEGVEAAAIKVPAVAVRVGDEIVVTELVVPPARAAPQAGLMALCEKTGQEVQLGEQQPGVGRNALADSKAVEAAGVCQENPADAVAAEAERRGTARGARSDHHDIPPAASDGGDHEVCSTRSVSLFG
jgi:hypothetical protein